MPEKLLIDSRQLAEMFSVSLEFVTKNRHRIVGAQRVGRLWRYNLADIQNCLTAKRNVIIPKITKKRF